MLHRSSRHFRFDLRASRRTGATIAAFAALLGVSTRVSRADTVYVWNNSGTEFTLAGDWNPNTGYPGSSYPGSNDTAQFSGPRITNPNVSTPDTILSLNFSDTTATGYTVSSSNGGALTLLSTISAAMPTVAVNGANTSGSNTISAPLIFGAAAGTTQTVQVAAGGTLNLTGNLSNINALTFLQLGNTATGTLVLSGTSSGLTAPVKLNGATLALANDSNLGTGTFTFGTTSTIQSVDTNTRTVGNVLGSFGGTTPIYTFGTASTGDLLFSSTTSASVNGANARTFTVNNANTTFAGAFTSSSSSGGGIIKLGSGNLILLGTNTYAGSSQTTNPAIYGKGTTITAGTLTIGNGTTAGAALPTASAVINNSALVINNTATDANTITAAVVGTGTFTKNGAGSLTLTPLTAATTYTSGSTAATVTATSGLAVGASVTGAGIAANTTITAIGTTTGNGTTATTAITLSTAPTASGTSATFGNTFSGAITVNNGTLIGNSGAGNSPTLSLGTGNISIGSTGILGTTQPDQALLGRITSAAAGSVLALSAGFSGVVNLDLSSSATLANLSLGATSNATLQATGSTLVPNNNTYRLGGGPGILTVQGALLTNAAGGATNNLVVSGTVNIATTNPSYTGTTTINVGGTLQGTQNSRLPSTTLLTVNGTNDLVTTGDTGTTQTVSGLSGSGTITNSSTATAVAPAKVFVVNSGSGTNTVFSGLIQDRPAASTNTAATLSLTKSGLGTLSLTGANTYSVATTINGGTLSANNATGSATGTSAVAVNGTSGTAFGVLGGGAGAANGGTLSALSGGATSRSYAPGILGMITGTVTVNNFGHLAPGNSVGTLTVGNLTLNSGSVLDYEFNGTANDLTSVTGALTLNNGSAVSVNLLQEGTANAFAAVGTYNLIQYGAGSVIDTTGLTVANALAGYNYSFVNDAGDSLLQLNITTTPVPEPATWVSALVGIGMIGYARCRRMRARA